MISSINGVSGFNASAIAQMREKMFSRIDTSGDGSIDKTEMSAFLAKTGQSDVSVDDIFSQFDSDGNGAISTSENETVQNMIQQQMQLMQAMGGMSGMMPPPPPPENGGQSSEDDSSAFSRIDANGDGVINAEELSQMIAHGPQGGLTAEEILNVADTDGDGSISQTEFASTKDKVREAMDTKMGHGVSKSDGADRLATLLDTLNANATNNDNASADLSSNYALLLQYVLSSYTHSMSGDGQEMGQGTGTYA